MVCVQFIYPATQLDHGDSWFPRFSMNDLILSPAGTVSCRHSVATRSRARKVSEREKGEKEEEGRTKEGQGKGMFSRGGCPPVLAVCPHLVLLRSPSPFQLPPANHLNDLGLLQEGQHRWSSLLIFEKRLNSRGSKVFPPAGLPDAFPQCLRL